MTNPLPTAREDGAPSVCLRCGERPTARGRGAVWCQDCYDGRRHGYAADWYADRDAWKARNAAPAPDARDVLRDAALALILERPPLPKRHTLQMVRWEERIAELLALPEYRAWRSLKERG